MTKSASRRGGTRRVLKIASALEEYLGRPQPSRRKSRPLDSLIATLLSQNTNDRNSYRAWLSLKREYPTWETVHAAPTRNVAHAIEVGGLKNQKARRIKAILRSILREHGTFSLDFLKSMSDEEAMDYLLAMKGVGSKTAACVLVFSLGRDVFPVDTHIHRICNRLGLVKTKSADETFDAMKELVPAGHGYPFHVNLIQYGRQTCRAVNPLCGQCVLYDECTFPLKQGNQLLTSAAPRSHGTDFLITEKIATSPTRHIRRRHREK
jgi:endonuclease III